MHKSQISLQKSLLDTMAELEQPSTPYSAHEDSEALCSLCQGRHINMTIPENWTSEPSLQIISSLGVQLSAPICMACRKDVSRLVNNSSHLPRWEKKTSSSVKIQCCIKELTVQEHHSKWLESIRQAIWYRVKFENEEIPSDDALTLYQKWEFTRVAKFYKLHVNRGFTKVCKYTQ